MIVSNRLAYPGFCLPGYFVHKIILRREVKGGDTKASTLFYVHWHYNSQSKKGDIEPSGTAILRVIRALYVRTLCFLYSLRCWLNAAICMSRCSQSSCLWPHLVIIVFCAMPCMYQYKYEKAGIEAEEYWVQLVTPFK